MEFTAGAGQEFGRGKVEAQPEPERLARYKKVRFIKFSGHYCMFGITAECFPKVQNS
jgi:hypothetical protein